MAIGPKGPPQKPGLSSRGRVIFDTVRGVPRVRPWPPKKPTKPGTKRHLTAKAFGAANRACKVTASVFYGEHWSATRGTPLLPRDLMIAMMYGRAFALTLEDGRIIRSMASRNDVSKSLDMIGNTPGFILRRGQNYWEAQSQQGAVVGAMLGLAATLTNVNYSSLSIRNWTKVIYDNGNWTDLSSFNSGFTVPPDISMVEVTACTLVTNVNSNAIGQSGLLKNGSAIFEGWTGAREQSSDAVRYFNFRSAAIPCEPGDTFQLNLGLFGDSSVQINAPYTTFSIKAVG